MKFLNLIEIDPLNVFGVAVEIHALEACSN